MRAKGRKGAEFLKIFFPVFPMEGIEILMLSILTKRPNLFLVFHLSRAGNLREMKGLHSGSPLLALFLGKGNGGVGEANGEVIV